MDPITHLAIHFLYLFLSLIIQIILVISSQWPFGNMLYKIISKIITRRIKSIFSNSITAKKFGFVKDRHIHEAMDASQEAIHSIKTRNQASFFFKFDLSKAYDKAS